MTGASCSANIPFDRDVGRCRARPAGAAARLGDLPGRAAQERDATRRGHGPRERPDRPDTHAVRPAASSATTPRLTAARARRTGSRRPHATRRGVRQSSSVACGGSPSATVSASSAASRSSAGLLAATRIRGGDCGRPHRLDRVFDPPQPVGRRPKSPPSAAGVPFGAGRPLPTPSSNRPPLSSWRVSDSQATRAAGAVAVRRGHTSRPAGPWCSPPPRRPPGTGEPCA